MRTLAVTVLLLAVRTAGALRLRVLASRAADTDVAWLTQNTQVGAGHTDRALWAITFPHRSSTAPGASHLLERFVRGRTAALIATLWARGHYRSLQATMSQPCTMFLGNSVSKD